jgi:hypothetical protein
MSNVHTFCVHEYQKKTTNADKRVFVVFHPTNHVVLSYVFT